MTRSGEHARLTVGKTALGIMPQTGTRFWVPVMEDYQHLDKKCTNVRHNAYHWTVDPNGFEWTLTDSNALRCVSTVGRSPR